MSQFLKGLQDRVLLSSMTEQLNKANDRQVRDLAIEIHKQSINRRAISQNIINKEDNGLAPADQLELRTYPMRIEAMTTSEVRADAISRYERLLADGRDFETLMARVLRIEELG